jgi:hypothetical protein
LIENHFPDVWIDCGSLIFWPSFSLDFLLWGYIKENVHTVEVEGSDNLINCVPVAVNIRG